MKGHADWQVNVLRPTVIFGERNRGNVYNLLSQIARGRFLMVGKGENMKSMIVVTATFGIDSEKYENAGYTFIKKWSNYLKWNELITIKHKFIIAIG